jgi:hypothetical protein
VSRFWGGGGVDIEASYLAAALALLVASYFVVVVVVFFKRSIGMVRWSGGGWFGGGGEASRRCDGGQAVFAIVFGCLARFCKLLMALTVASLLGMVMVVAFNG